MKTFKKTFDKLLERMELCINHREDYFEHLIKQVMLIQRFAYHFLKECILTDTKIRKT